MVEKGKSTIEKMYESYDKHLTSRTEKYLIEFGKEIILPENSISVLKKRYLMKNEKGETIETPKQLFARVASNIAYPDFVYSDGNELIYKKTAEEFYDSMINNEFMPNSPTLMNAGRAFQQLAACFVLDIPDSIEKIFQTVKDTAVIQKSGGGTGFAFDKMRRKGGYISTTHGKASGPLSFANNLNQATESINQGGFRRGANMGCMDIHHPDILEFIYYKEDESKNQLNNFNISVKATDEFMKAVKENKLYTLKWNNIPLTLDDLLLDRKSVEEGQFQESQLTLRLSLDNKHILNPFRKDKNGNLQIIGEIIDNKVHLYADYVLKQIAELAHNNGEPGILFIDTINKYNPTPHLGKIESTNPCGEQPLLPYEACNLGSVNLGKFIKNMQTDYKNLERIVNTGIHFLDNVIDMNKAPIPQIQEMIEKNRKIGLGVMGFADLLSELSIEYDSEKGIKTAEEIMFFISKTAKKKSVEIAKERGVFPAFKGSIYDNGKIEDRIRNAALTTIAPTGTISFIAGGCSSGIEPFYSILFIHKDADGYQREVIAVNLEKELKKNNIDVERVLEEIKMGKGLSEISFVPKKIKDAFRTSFDVDYRGHILMQAAFQKYTDNAVSKTINLPNNASVNDVLNSYLLAYETGCKGVTVYRDGSRETQVLNAKEKKNGIFFAENEYNKPISLPKMMVALRIQQPTQFGNMHIDLSLDAITERLYESFVSLGRGGEETNATLEAIGRLSSLCLRTGISEDDIISQLDGIGTKDSIVSRDGKISSLPQAFATGLKRYKILRERGLIKDVLSGKACLSELYDEISDELRTGDREYKTQKKISSNQENGNKTLTAKKTCPDCNGTLMFTEGCMKCSSCGYSKC